MTDLSLARGKLMTFNTIDMTGEADASQVVELNEILIDGLDTIEAAFVVIKDNVFVYANQGLNTVFGFEADFSLIGESYSFLFNKLTAQGAKSHEGKTREEIQAFIAEKYQNNESFSSEIKLKDGRWVKASNFPRKAGGRILSFSDVTSLKAAQLDAERADKAKTEFLANMSHEIRTPMNGIMGMTQLLANCDLGERETKFVETIHRSGKALLTIINDILDFSKIEAGHVELDQDPFVLRECLEDVMALLSTAANDTGVDLLLRIDPNIPETYIGDVGRVRQIVTNLVGNALKFTHQGHVVINVNANVVGDTALLSLEVQDTGIGIDPEKLSHIFEKFNQADGSTTREYEGTGLGLSIAKNLAKLMNGDILAESEVGRGSKFTINIELGVGETIEKPASNTFSDISGNILIVDDITINHEILKEQLSSDICKCISVSSAKKGLAVLAKARDKNINIDLIIVDYQMPEITGEDFIRSLKAHDDYKNIPIVLYTSVDNDGLKQRLKKIGINGYLTKPARYEEIKQTVSKALSNSQSIKMKSAVISSVEPHSNNQKTSKDDSKAEVDILIAEDNEVNQMLIQYIMEDLGVSYKIVPNGRLAFDKWKLLSPKIVLMDISMPEWNGYEATQAIRACEAKDNRPRTPIIAVTAHAMARDEKSCLDNDMDGYLSKPLAIGKLRDMIAKWTDLKISSKKSAA